MNTPPTDKPPRHYEEMARRYIEGVGGLFDLYRYEMASPLHTPPEVEGAAWILKSLTNPRNRADLDALVLQSNLRGERKVPPCSSS